MLLIGQPMMLPGTTDNERALNSDTSSIMRDGRRGCGYC